MPADPHYLVALNDTPAAMLGFTRALQLSRADKHATLRLIHVVEVDRRLALDADLPDAADAGERILSLAEEEARRHKVKCRVVGDILQAREAGPALVEEATALGVDAIILAIRARGKEEETLQLGRTAEYVLRAAPCEVILVRQEAAT